MSRFTHSQVLRIFLGAEKKTKGHYNMAPNSQSPQSERGGKTQDDRSALEMMYVFGKLAGQHPVHLSTQTRRIVSAGGIRDKHVTELESSKMGRFLEERKTVRLQ